MPRVVITGLGAISPIGNDVNTFWDSLVEGQSGAGPLTGMVLEDLPVSIACHVKDFDPASVMDHKQTRRTGPGQQFALAAALQALTDADFTVNADNAERVGVVLNTGLGEIGEIELKTHDMLERGPKAVGPFLIPRVMPNGVSSLVSIEIGVTGPVLTSTLACASGNYAILEAFHFLQRGETDLMIAGGTEALTGSSMLAAFANMKALSNYAGDPQQASRPFDAERDGFVYGEGAGVMVLETEEHAQERGAHIYAEVLGGRLTADAHHITAPDPAGVGAARAMDGALDSAGLQPEDVDVIYAHGTSTPLNDKMETGAIKAVYGEYAYDLAVTGTKSMLGHTLGAAGALSALAAVRSLTDSIIPPTINYTTPDPACDLDYVPNAARQQPVRVAMVNAFGFGGQNVALLLGRYENAS